MRIVKKSIKSKVNDLLSDKKYTLEDRAYLSRDCIKDIRENFLNKSQIL